jgi:hypothetical protein
MTKPDNSKVIKSKNQNYSSSIQEWVEMGQVWKEHVEKLEKENKNLKISSDFYKSRCELLQKSQRYMRDPERTIVCDILANNNLLPDPEGKRYGKDLRPLVQTSFFPKDLEDYGGNTPIVPDETMEELLRNGVKK